MKIILALILVALASPAFAQLPCRVVSITDGDTWRCDSGIKIRGWGYDSPEGKQPYGHEAREALRQLIDGKMLACQRKGASRDRVVGQCWLPDGREVASAMVRSGYGWNYQQFSRGRFADDERVARAAHAGLWADPNPVPPWDWRKAHRGQ